MPTASWHLKPLYWVGSSKKDLLEMPGVMQDAFGYALYLTQVGGKADHAKPIRGFGSAGVLEVVEDWRGDTYRVVYTVRIANGVYVLHCFQKKSKKGSATAKPDIEKIRERLKAAEAHAAGAKP